jgi:hypothetical protein
VAEAADRALALCSSWLWTVLCSGCSSLPLPRRLVLLVSHTGNRGAKPSQTPPPYDWRYINSFLWCFSIVVSLYDFLSGQISLSRGRGEEEGERCSVSCSSPFQRSNRFKKRHFCASVRLLTERFPPKFVAWSRFGPRKGQKAPQIRYRPRKSQNASSYLIVGDLTRSI